MSGSVLVVFKWKKDRNRRWKSCIHLVEADRISNPNYVLDTITCRGGHQLDEDGETLGFWVRRQHPGDIIAIPQLPIWDYVPRKTTWGRTQSVLLARKDRIDQHYFLSALATVVPEFKVLGDYKKAELQATLANAIVAMVIESSAQFGDIAELFEGPADYMSKRGEWNNKVKKQGLGFGATIPLMPGDKMSSYNPGRPNEKAVEFLKWATRHIATGLGVPAETITHDWSELNYSSARTVILDAMRAYNQFRAVLVDRFYQPLLENLFEEAVWAGKIPDCTPTEFYQNKAAWTKSRWSGPGKGWVDPDKEAKAAKGRLETGLTTLEIECDDQGYDWLDIADQRAAERDYYRSHGMAYAPEMAAENVTTRATVDETAVQIEDDKDPPNDPSQD
jgi:lambda family phage portal protein